MRYTKTGIIIALIGAEIFIAGAILAVLGGHHSMPGTSVAQASTYKPPTFDPIDAGAAPRVEIDDADSTVTVGVSADGRVHVADNTTHGGMTWTTGAAELSVERTADGVRIYRPSGGNTWVALAGWFDRRITVEVPHDASVDISACAGADVSGMSGAVRVRSDDGDIAARDLTGDTDLQSSDGHIELSNVRAKHVSVASSDGNLRIQDVTADSLEGSTSDGSISAGGLRVGGGSLQTSDGSIDLSFISTNVTIHAHTDDGNVSFDGRKSDSNDDDSSTGDFHIGAGGGSMQVATQDGDIHIITNGAQ